MLFWIKKLYAEFGYDNQLSMCTAAHDCQLGYFPCGRSQPENEEYVSFRNI